MVVALARKSRDVVDNKCLHMALVLSAVREELFQPRAVGRFRRLAFLDEFARDGVRMASAVLAARL